MFMSIRAYKPTTNEKHYMPPKTLLDYSEMVDSWRSRGYKAHNLENGFVEFISSESAVVFTVKPVNENRAMAYVDW